MKKAFSYEYKGKTYYFETSELMEKFKADPETKLSQVSSTCCAGKMTLDKRTALKSTYDEKEYYFCSDKCKAGFDADPQAYLKKTSSTKCGDRCCGSKEAKQNMTKTSEI
jgi:YHS domain-containing protein